MATKIRLQADFKEFLKLLASNEVEYLLIGGYAVAYYGYLRPTGDMDLWIAISSRNAERVAAALNKKASGRLKDLADLEQLSKDQS